jgi:polyphosphate kinase
MNSLLERGVIEALYQASQAGVQIDLIVRGICSLRPGIKRISENIRVKSIVGRFLEHSRIFYFHNDGRDELYCGSADWMPRNLFERCEVIFPVRDPALRARLRNEILAAYLADTEKSRIMQPDGSYLRAHDTATQPFNAQEFFIRLVESKATMDNIPKILAPEAPGPVRRARKAVAV